MPERTLRFQHKLWQIVNNCRSGAVSWSDTGHSVIFKFSLFKKEYLDRNDKFCKSNKIASFIRQLNLYGFRKLMKTNSYLKRKVHDQHEFQNNYFQRGRKDLLEYVVRNYSIPGPSNRSVCEDGRSKKRGRKAKKKRNMNKAKNIDEFNRNDHIYWENDTKSVIDHPKKENKIRNTQKNILYNKAKRLLNMFRGTADELQNSTILVSEDAPSRVLSENSSKQDQHWHSVNIDNTATEMKQTNSANGPSSLCPVLTNAEETEQSQNATVQNVIDVTYGKNENEHPRLMSETENVQQRKNLNSKAHHSRKRRLGRKKKWYFLLDDFKGIDNGNDEFSDELNIVDEPKSFLALEELPEPSWSKINLNCTNCEMTEEYFEIKTASMKMKNRMANLGCICDTNIPPSCVFRYLMKTEKPETEFLCF